ncbi:MAG TPA: DNA-3-methyladenine glycosylase [Pyrinomonadaceae bacterium]|jgi:DNA-3-methyladenine glycosylase
MSEKKKKLPREFYTRSRTLLIARQLLGKRLVVPAADGRRVSGQIVETEAYMGPADRASHAYNNRRTLRTETMFQAGGRAYVYFIYGMYYQFNVVTNRASIPHAVLIRAIEPEEGIELMRARRPVKLERELTSGPGKLCAALGLDRTFDGADLLGERVWIEETGRQLRPAQISTGVRIGIDYAQEYAAKPWRFWIKENLYVSRK